ncbi:hypothetical protein [Shinella sp.]|uniref:hypothetical protein n=1 Tax=Shinella sp. TaxID=1870904 RepID=UPI003F6FC7EF
MANSFFQIVAPATDRLLAPIAALRTAAGLAGNDGSRDAELTVIGQRASAEIVGACRIAVGEAENGEEVEPTLRRELVRETFSASCNEVLILSRRHAVKIASVTQDGIAVTLDPRSVRSESGLLYRWTDGRQWLWTGQEIVVEYEAGFEMVPFSLVGVVTDLVRLRLSQAEVDPLVKATRIEIPDIETIQTDRWVGATPGADATGLPADFMPRLARFYNPVA